MLIATPPNVVGEKLDPAPESQLIAIVRNVRT